jgi:hypothetical protein
MSHGQTSSLKLILLLLLRNYDVLLIYYYYNFIFTPHYRISIDERGSNLVPLAHYIIYIIIIIIIIIIEFIIYDHLCCSLSTDFILRNMASVNIIPPQPIWLLVSIPLTNFGLSSGSVNWFHRSLTNRQYSVRISVTLSFFLFCEFWSSTGTHFRTLWFLISVILYKNVS